MSKRIKEIKEMSAAQALNHYTNAGKWPCRKPGGARPPFFTHFINLIKSFAIFVNSIKSFNWRLGVKSTLPGLLLLQHRMCASSATDAGAIK
jgi:hypothetical protein